MANEKSELMKKVREVQVEIDRAPDAATRDFYERRLRLLDASLIAELKSELVRKA